MRSLHSRFTISQGTILGAVSNDLGKMRSLLHEYDKYNLEHRYSFAGETIEAKMYSDVTMLFSDIVGFTAICSTATPMMVVNMLQNLYEQFDIFCGQLDVYKVR